MILDEGCCAACVRVRIGCTLRPRTCPPTQGPIGEAFQRGSHAACNKLLMEFITMNGQPLSIVRSQHFKK
jgi:hypothetical protein